MKLTHEGLTLWYGTPDAPAPFEQETVPRSGAALVVGVHPAHPMNAVEVRYRVDGGITQTVAGRALRTDYARDLQYFAVAFPRFVTGELVEYAAHFSCGGRHVPALGAPERFQSHLQLEPKATPLARAAR